MKSSPQAYWEELHALDYLVYAHLQRGEDAEAKGVIDQIMAVEQVWPEHDFAAAYAVGAAPARYALERHAWQEAVELPRPAAHLVERFPFDAAHVEFARAIGQLRLGDVDGARVSLAMIKQLGEASTDPRAAYFRSQLDIQHAAIEALIAHAEGRSEAAVAQLGEAADEDDLLGKHPVSPSNIYPVRELLAELLLELDRPEEALAQFRRSLEINPGRFMALAGAARASERAGLPEEARVHYGRMYEQAGHSDRPEVQAARDLLAGR